jgi:hypothetical protein
MPSKSEVFEELCWWGSFKQAVKFVGIDGCSGE